MDSITVVLIEDHDLTRIGTRTALQRKDGIQVVGEAADATKGLQLLLMHKPDVAIVDVGLPDMDGIELTRKFRNAHSETEEPPTRVLMLTMNDSEDTVMAAFAAGADSYCMKDVSTEQLVTAIQSTYEGNHWIDPSIAQVVLKQACPQDARNGSAQPKVAINAVDADYTQILESSPLTEREMEVLQLIVEGNSNEEIGQRLYLTVGTVKTHVRNILNKMCVSDRTQAAVRALRAGLVA